MDDIVFVKCLSPGGRPKWECDDCSSFALLIVELVYAYEIKRWRELFDKNTAPPLLSRTRRTVPELKSANQLTAFLIQNLRVAPLNSRAPPAQFTIPGPPRGLARRTA